jgi:hypothetical protein
MDNFGHFLLHVCCTLENELHGFQLQAVPGKHNRAISFRPKWLPRSHQADKRQEAPDHRSYRSQWPESTSSDEEDARKRNEYQGDK